MSFNFMSRIVTRAAREECHVEAELYLSDGIKLPGMIMKIGDSVVLFREASTYVMMRDGAAVKVTFEGGEIDGTITKSSSEGYLIKATAERMVGA